MEHFLINSSVCLFSLWLVYKLLLENTSWHQFKRYYFLAAILISAVIPFIVVRTVVVPFTSGGTIDFTTMEAATSEVIETGFTLDWNMILLAIYGIGVFIMAARFIKNLYDLRIKTSDEVSSYENYKLVLRELIQIPHSFFGRIYASKTDYQSGAIPNAVLEHEKAHLDQKHSIDILFIELLIVLMWFNPLMYLIKYSIKLNHEFLADQAVLANGVDTKSYQETLLSYSSNSQNRALANTFNFPIIKKRFTIMKTHTTTASGLLRSLAIVPVLALLFIACGEEEVEYLEVEETIIVEDDSKKINEKTLFIKVGTKEGTITLKNGYKYTYKYNSEGELELYDAENLKWDYTADGYTLPVIEVEVIEEEPLRGKPIAESKKVVSSINEDFTYDLKNNKAIESSLGDLKKKYGEDIIEITEIAENNGFKYYRSNDASETIFLNEYFEVVDLRKLSDGKLNLSKFILPPPPPPLSPLEFIEANKEDLNYYINDKEVNAAAAIKTIKSIGQDKVQVLKDANGKQSIRIKMSSDDKKLINPPLRPEIIEVEKNLEQALQSSVNSVSNQIKGKLYVMNTIQIQDSTHATKQMMAEYKKLIQDSYRGNDRVWKNSDLEKLKKIYAQMSSSQKSSVEKLPALLSFDLNEVQPNQPNRRQFEALKNKSEYAVWIDGKVIDNKILEQYTYSDFVHFAKSKVYNNARSFKFPQPFQVRLFTKAGFEQVFRNKVDIK